MSHDPFQQRLDSSQAAAASLCELSRGRRSSPNAPTIGSRSDVLNWIPLLDNFLTIISDIQENIVEFLTDGFTVKGDTDTALLQEFHQKLTSRVDVLSCITKMHRKVEDVYMLPLTEQVSASKSQKPFTSLSNSHKSTILPLYRTLDSCITQIQLNLRQLHISKHSQSHHNVIHDLVLRIQDHCSELKDVFTKIAEYKNDDLPLLPKLQDEEVISLLNTQVLDDENVKELTNEIYMFICKSGSRDIEEMVKLIQNLVKGSYMEAILEKGKWSSLFKFGQESRQMNTPETLPTIEVPDIAQEQANPLKRKLIIDYSPEAKKTALTVYKSAYDRWIKSRNTLSRPSKYYKKVGDSESAHLVWDKDGGFCLPVSEEKSSSVPQFNAYELHPSFHEGSKLGCSHYARRCKLRHPTTGKLFPCRLCDGANSPPLDRFAVKEILCMQCNSLQPSNHKCINPDCTSKGTPFARYVCLECNLFDDDPKKDIFHCPHCNVCRLGKGLGIDFKHCMKCDACISIDRFDNHKCVPKRLNQLCSLCSIGPPLGQSTEPIQSMNCGHTFHSSCLSLFPHLISPTKLKCPICRREDKIVQS